MDCVSNSVNMVKWLQCAGLSRIMPAPSSLHGFSCVQEVSEANCYTVNAVTMECFHFFFIVEMFSPREG